MSIFDSELYDGDLWLGDHWNEAAIVLVASVGTVVLESTPMRIVEGTPIEVSDHPLRIVEVIS